MKEIGVMPEIHARARKVLLVLLPMLLLFALSPLPAQEPAAQGRVIGAKMSTHPAWFKDSFLDLPEDASEAAEAGKHLILFMEAEGCPYCHKMIEENFANAPYRDFIQEHFDVIALNFRGSLQVEVTEDLSLTEQEVAEYYRVRFTPTLVFLDSTNTPVARVSGYRNVEDFKIVLDFVQERAYRAMSLNEYAAARQAGDVYAFREHPQIVALDDLRQTGGKPLAVLFEDSACVACDALHDSHLADPEIRAILDDMTLVRVDTRSDVALIDPQGNATTARAFADALGIEYRPSIVLFDGDREVTRIDGMLYRYHFGGILDYVAGRHFERFPDSPFPYINEKTAELRARGENVIIADE
jgi:thioredoxin-related protein